MRFGSGDPGNRKWKPEAWRGCEFKKRVKFHKVMKYLKGFAEPTYV